MGIFGLGSGIDFSLFIDQIIKAETDRLVRTVGRREVKAQSEQLTFTNIRGALQSLDTSVKDLKIAQDFKTKVAKSSDPNVFTAIATLNAPVQSVKLTVESLATNEVSRTSFTGVDDVVHNGADTTISITVRGVEHELNIPGNSTFSEIANIINGAKIGVTANVYDSKDGTANPARLSITDNKLGIFSTEMDPPPNVTFDFSNLDTAIDDPEVAVEPQNTEVILNGESIFSQGHTLVGIIPGVNVSLLSAAPGQEKTLTVQETTGDSSKRIQTLVERFNEVVGIIRKATFIDPSDPNQAPQGGASTLRSILTRLQGAITGVVEGLPDTVSVRSLADLGVKTASFNADSPQSNGLLEFNAGQFNAQINNNFDDVVKFFEGFTEDAITYKGFADKMMEVMGGFLRSPDGSVTAKLSSLGETLKRLNEDKLRAIDRINAKEEMLTGKFARLEAQLAQLNGQQGQLTAAIESINNNNRFIANRSR